MTVRWGSVREPADSVVVYLPVAPDLVASFELSERFSPVQDVKLVRFDHAYETGSRRSLPSREKVVVKDAPIDIATMTTSRIAQRGRTELVFESATGATAVVRSTSEAERRFFSRQVLIPTDVLTVPKRGYLLRQILLRFVEDKSKAPEEGEAWVPVVRVHRPSREGCSSVYTTTATKTRSHSASFKIGGVGFDGSATFDFTYGEECRATQSCKELSVPVTIEKTFGFAYHGRRRLGPAERLHFKPARGASREDYHDLDRRLDFCGQNERLVDVDVDRNLRRATGESGDTLTSIFAMGRTIQGQVSVSWQLPSGIGTLALGYQRSCRRLTQVATTFAPGAHYFGYGPPHARQLERCWTTVA